MKVVVPIKIVDGMLGATSLPENDHPVYNGATAYAFGDQVISTASHTIYRSLVDGHTGSDPDAETAAFADPLVQDPTTKHWQAMSATNRWKPFDQKPSVQATSADNIDFFVTPGEIIDSVALFNVDAVRARIVVTSASNGVVFSQEALMQDEAVVTDWYSYYIEPITSTAELVFTDIPPYGDAEVRVTLWREGATVGLGQVVLGRARQIGETVIGSTDFRGLDFSKVEQDEFGDLTTVRRAATRISNFDVFMENHKLLTFDGLMRALRGGVAAVWIGDDNTAIAATNYGFYLDYRVVYSTDRHSILSLQIQGIV